MKKILTLIFIFFAPTFTLAQERMLTGDEIREWLTEASVAANGWSQKFHKNGETIYSTPNRPPSQGRWRVQGNQYCSIWPPVGDWACYDVLGKIEGDKKIIIWVSPSGHRDIATVKD